MTLPTIDIASLPVLDQTTGLFGSLVASSRPGIDDTLIVIMVYVYDVGHSLV